MLVKATTPFHCAAGERNYVTHSGSHYFKLSHLEIKVWPFCLTISLNQFSAVSPAQLRRRLTLLMRCASLNFPGWPRGLQDSKGATKFGVHLNIHEKDRCDFQVETWDCFKPKF